MTVPLLRDMDEGFEVAVAAALPVAKGRVDTSFAVGGSMLPCREAE